MYRIGVWISRLTNYVGFPNDWIRPKARPINIRKEVGKLRCSCIRGSIITGGSQGHSPFSSLMGPKRHNIISFLCLPYFSFLVESVPYYCHRPGIALGSRVVKQSCRRTTITRSPPPRRKVSLLWEHTGLWRQQGRTSPSPRDLLKVLPFRNRCRMGPEIAGGHRRRSDPAKKGIQDPTRSSTRWATRPTPFRKTHRRRATQCFLRRITGPQVHPRNDLASEFRGRPTASPWIMPHPRDGFDFAMHCESVGS